MLEQIKNVAINDVLLELPVNYWLKTNDEGDFERKVSLNFWVYENLLNLVLDIESSFTEICNKEDLFDFLSINKIVINDIEDLRLKLIITKKHGEKIVYENGSNSFCFNCHYDKKYDLLFVFNFSGTKSVENIYLHGVWKNKV